MRCYICLEEITEFSCITECKHTFHTACLLKSIVETNNMCPICRHPLVKKQTNDTIHRTIRRQDFNDSRRRGPFIITQAQRLHLQRRRQRREDEVQQRQNSICRNLHLLCRKVLVVLSGIDPQRNRNSR